MKNANILENRLLAARQQDAADSDCMASLCLSFLVPLRRAEVNVPIMSIAGLAHEDHSHHCVPASLHAIRAYYLCGY